MPIDTFSYTQKVFSAIMRLLWIVLLCVALPGFEFVVSSPPKPRLVKRGKHIFVVLIDIEISFLCWLPGLVQDETSQSTRETITDEELLKNLNELLTLLGGNVSLPVNIMLIFLQIIFL